MIKFQASHMIGEKYKIIKKIGAGSFGTIYLGKSCRLFNNNTH